MILYLKDLEDATKTPRHHNYLQEISREQNKFAKISRYTPKMYRLRKNIGKQFHL
jgi:hypothetical protein